MARTSPVRLRFQLAAFSAVRTVLNTGHRMVYPFLPAIARGLGVDLQAVAAVVTARSSLGLLAPLFGSTADSRGRKTAMLMALGLFALGLAVVALWPTYWAFFIALLLAAAGKLIFDAAMQAYVGDRVEYSRRGLAIAVTEFGWSGAFLLGAPVAGWLIGRWGWRAPFPWLSLLGLGGAMILWRMLPADTTRRTDRPSLAKGVRTVLAHPSAIAGLAVALLLSTANETVNIIFGVWMEDAFGLQVVALGAASAVIGFAELGGEGLVAGLADRLGKRRAVGLGIILNTLASVGLPILGSSLTGSLVGLFLFYITFEFALVSAIPLMTELVPGARATVMSANIASHSAGRALGALLGPILLASGLRANSLAAAGLDLVALVILLMLVRE